MAKVSNSSRSKWQIAVAFIATMSVQLAAVLVVAPTQSHAVDTLPVVEFSAPGGKAAEAVSVSLTSSTTGASIYYTTDGSEPGSTSTRYSAPVTISRPTSLRVRAIAGDAAGPITTRTFIVGVAHDVPILAISAPSSVFFDDATGLFPNAQKNISAPSNVEFYDGDGTQGFSQIATTVVDDKVNASLPQKSLAFTATAGTTFAYPLFPTRPAKQYRSFIARNAGKDFNHTEFRDLMTQGLVGDVADLAGTIRTPNVDAGAGRPVAAYLNGEYYGLLNLQERADESLVATHHGVADAALDLLENGKSTLGDLVAAGAMNAFATGADLSVDANLKKLGSYYDLDNLVDSYAFMAYVDARDWPENNNVIWRDRSTNGAFRSILKDLDLSMGFVPGGAVAIEADATGATLKRMLTAPLDAKGRPDLTSTSQVFRAAMSNRGFRDAFVNRLNDYANVVLSPERIASRVKEYSSRYGAERARHLSVFGTGDTAAIEAEAGMRAFATARPASMVEQIQGLYSDISGRSPVAVSVSPVGSGGIDISSLTLHGSSLPATYSLFNGTEIPLRAVKPAAGFVFDHWTVMGGVVTDKATATTTLRVMGEATVQAVFIPDRRVAQSIEFPSIPSKVLPAAPFAIFATASSGFPVTFAIASGPATIVGNIITLTGETGIVIVEATQAGDALYLPAIASAPFIVTKPIPTTLTFGPLPNLTVAADLGSRFAVASWPAPSATSTCFGGARAFQTGGPTSGSDVPIGVVTVTYRAADGCGNSVERSFTITVVAPPGLI
jgi:CotH kinase protein/Chitobiase/beta-hexosaminidase C-terminal domain/Divergent InlB B-repeat domain